MDDALPPELKPKPRARGRARTVPAITTPHGLPDGAHLCILASGSAGNSSVLAMTSGSVTRLCLIDLGLSPRRTFRLLAERGLRPDQIDSAIITHLDSDHLHAGWLNGLPRHASLRLYQRHARTLAEMGWGEFGVTIRTFDGPFDLDPGITVRPMLMAHDEAGVSTLRFDLPAFGGGTLGFATDVGRVTLDFVEHLRADFGHGPGVDVLAIESNYCPRMQLDSDRPIYLKRRIMGGRGHLSNHEAAEAIAAIQPREHVVLLHLSRQCNDPKAVAELHQGADYAWTISSQAEPTRWVTVAPAHAKARTRTLSPRLAASATLWTG